MASNDYGTYDRVLDWFSDRRQSIAKWFVLVAVLAMIGGLLAGAAIAIGAS